ncbi:anhydro-N-acetylmuramic acid kinase, partial [Aeromonas caviae]
MTERYIGLMSGTSMDGIDAVLVTMDREALRVEAALCHPWPADTARTLHELCTPGENEIDRMGVADNLVAREFAAATQALLAKAALTPKEIRAIGSHGQTIRHRPALGFTLQIGNAALLAAL